MSTTKHDQFLDKHKNTIARAELAEAEQGLEDTWRIVRYELELSNGLLLSVTPAGGSWHRIVNHRGWEPIGHGGAPTRKDAQRAAESCAMEASSGVGS